MFVITGGGSGLGKALAVHLASLGHQVTICGRHEETLKVTVLNNPTMQYCVADVATEEGRQELLRYLSSFGTLKGLVHNAGVIEPIMPAMTIPKEDWHRCLATNLDAPLLLTQALKTQLKGGRVLHIGSGAAYFPVEGWTAYCVSKAALSMLTRCLQLEQSDMYFSSVMPGIADTAMQGLIRQTSNMSEEKQAFFCDLKRNHRLVLPQTVALFLSWLMLEVEVSIFSSQEWDIYDTKHHEHWLKPPHQIPVFDE